MMNEKFDHLRNPNASTQQTLDTQTIRWMQALDDKHRPGTLARMFPRIANRLAALWIDPQATVTYLDELMFDDRGQRQGFPIAIGLELATLKELIVNRKALEQASAATGMGMRR